MSDTEIQGRKIFFLHPSAVVMNRVIEELAQQEFEVYIAKDHHKIKRVLQKFPDSIVFIDINEGGVTEAEWENWVRTISGALPDVAIGVISGIKKEDIIKKYVDVLKVKCGYTVLKSDLNQSIIQILDHLKNVDAKGRRKYIRAVIESPAVAMINFNHNSNYINGNIKDISVVGISCAFNQDPNLAKNTLFKDIQIKLQTTIIKVEAIVFGSRLEGKLKTYVFLFTKRVDPDVRSKIRKYIQQTLQSKLDPLLK